MNIQKLQKLLLLFLVLASNTVQSQQKTFITGIVKDANSPLQGVIIEVKGQKTFALSDATGRYSIEVNNPSKAVLIFTMVGYQPIELKPGTSGTLDVEMTAVLSTLNDIVVVGYGTARKKDLTGSISSLDSKTLRDVPVLNVNQALQGRAAGVLVQQGNMRPGGGVRVNIRGISSINNGVDPIYVIDGVITQGNISELNPEDIESVDVLKDASAAAIYGARGANGVVIITTKKGKPEKFELNYDSYVGSQSIIQKLPMMSGPEYAQLRRDADRNVASQDLRPIRTDAQLFSATELQSINAGRTYDWQDEILRNALITNHTLSMTGGNAKTTFFSSINYFKQEGIIINSDYERKSVRFNLTHKVNNRITVGNTFNFGRTKENIVPGGIFYAALSSSPLQPFTNDDGSYPLLVANNFQANPVANARLITNEVYGNRFLGSLFVEIAIVSNLKFKTSFGFDNLQRNNNYYSPRTVQEGNSRNGYAFIGDTYNNYWNWENTFSFDKRIKDHRVNAVAGFTMEENRFNSNSVSAQNFPTDIYTFKNLAAAQIRNQPESYFERWRIASFLGRLNYSWKDRYYATFTARRDGNSKFGVNNKYAFFPSGSLAWRFTEESFMPFKKTVTNGKLRLSYGISGNPNIPPYRSYTQYVSNNSLNYSFGNSFVTGLGNSNGVLGNPNIQWEEAKQFNAGLEFELLSRINVTIDYFNIQNENLILDRTLPPSSGFNNITYNIGGLRNHGLDISVNALVINTKDWQWSVNANWSRYRNEITSLEGGVKERLVQQSDFGFNILRVGSPLGLRWDYLYGGVWQQGETIIRPGGKPGVPGDMKIVDVNGDRRIDAADQTIVGDLNTKWYGGFSTDLTYKNISLNIVANYRVGNDIPNRVWDFYMDGRGTFINNLTEMNNRWTSNNTNTAVPRATIDFRHYDNSSRYMESGSYLRIRGITLAYNLPVNIIKPAIQKARIYFTTVNPFTISNFRGYDPESDPAGFGIDVYPSSKSFMAGINITF